MKTKKNPTHNSSLTQKRMLTPLEIELLQKDKRDSFEKMQVIMQSAWWINKNKEKIHQSCDLLTNRNY